LPLFIAAATFKFINIPAKLLLGWSLPMGTYMVLIPGLELFCACILQRLSMLIMIRKMYPTNLSVMMNSNTQLVFFFICSSPMKIPVEIFR